MSDRLSVVFKHILLGRIRSTILYKDHFSIYVLFGSIFGLLIYCFNFVRVDPSVLVCTFNNRPLNLKRKNTKFGVFMYSVFCFYSMFFIVLSQFESCLKSEVLTHHNVNA